MKATNFEDRHQTLLRLLIAGAAFLPYGFDREDVVWHFIKKCGLQTRTLEHSLFVFATILIGPGAYVCAAAQRALASLVPAFAAAISVDADVVSPARHSGRYLGEFLYALGIRLLAPISGCSRLVGGESVLLIRLWLRGSANFPSAAFVGKRIADGAMRVESVKWGIFIAMIVFSVTLRDRDAEVLIAITIIIGLLVNIRPRYDLCRSRS